MDVVNEGAPTGERTEPPEGVEPPPEARETRSWTDPRTGEGWRILTVGGEPECKTDGTPRIVVFQQDGRRYWVGYCGPTPLAEMQDTDLVLLLDSTAVAV